MAIPKILLLHKGFQQQNFILAEKGPGSGNLHYNCKNRTCFPLNFPIEEETNEEKFYAETWRILQYFSISIKISFKIKLFNLNINNRPDARITEIYIRTSEDASEDQDMRTTAF